eukprot:6373868-Alexandrium_andersonii.AAC.1
MCIRDRPREFGGGPPLQWPAAPCPPPRACWASGSRARPIAPSRCPARPAPAWRCRGDGSTGPLCSSSIPGPHA